MDETDKASANIKDTNELDETICISEETLNMMDESMKNLNNGKAGKVVDVSKLKESK